MNLINTYLICNSSHVIELRKIKHFQLELGVALLQNQKYSPGDVNIQKHHMFHNDILVKCGSIGSLPIYNSSKYTMQQICIANDDKIEIYVLDYSKTLYDNINTMLDTFFKKYELIKDVKTTKEEVVVVEEEVYVKPNKSLSEMTQDERVMYVRNMK